MNMSDYFHQLIQNTKDRNIRNFLMILNLFYDLAFMALGTEFQGNQ